MPALAFAVLFALLAVVVQLTLAGDPARPIETSRRDAATERERGVPLDPFVWRLAVFALLMGTAGGAAGRFFPLYAEEALGFSLATAGLLTALGGLLGMVARVVVGRLAEGAHRSHAPARLPGPRRHGSTASCSRR